MIIVLKQDATEEQLQHLIREVESLDCQVHVIHGEHRNVVAVIGEEDVIRTKPLEAFPGVESASMVMKPYKMASREFQAHNTVIELPVPGSSEKVVIGGDRVVMIAGPCSIENREMLFDVGRVVKERGARVLRAGAFKPRTSPYSFQGLGVKGLSYLVEARNELQMPIITEVMDTRDVELVAEAADIIQIGARNMQNFNLLKAVGKTSKPVLIKRGLSATIDELLMSAEYVMSQGNAQVMLCERGIRTYEKATRNTLDLSAVPVLKKASHLPVIVDPSHATGIWDLVPPMARAGVAAGADGIVVEVHFEPEKALSDGPQALMPDTFERVMAECRAVAGAIGRVM